MSLSEVSSTLAVDVEGQPGVLSLKELPPVTIPEVYDRVKKIFEALSREVWLPMGLRTVLAEEMAAVSSAAIAPSPNLGELARLMTSVAHFTFTLGNSALNSAAVIQIRVLDLELEEYRRLCKAETSEESDSF